MAFSLSELFTIGIIYLLLFFGSAFATEKNWLPSQLTSHPAVRLMALGVFAGAIAFNSMLGLAAQIGASYLVYFLGASATFLLAPLLLDPLCRVALSHKLGSLADVFAFRYPAPWVGGLVTVLMLLGLLPLVALQIEAIAATVHLLNQAVSKTVIAVAFCLTMTTFAILFGARHSSTRHKHQGLIVALSLESVVKLLAFIAIAVYAVVAVFGGISELNVWLTENQARLGQTETLLASNTSRMLLVIFFAATIALPHMYHILLTENDDARSLPSARWAFPLYLLVVSLCIPPIVWAADLLASTAPPEYAAIGIGLTMTSPAIMLLAFIATLAATSGVLIASTLALSSMVLNHLLLPLTRPPQTGDLDSRLVNRRRQIIAGIIATAFGMQLLLDEQASLAGIGIVTFVAMLQFLPGLIGTFYWRRANKQGLLAGLLTGFAVWAALQFYPLLHHGVFDDLLQTWPGAETSRLLSTQLMADAVRWQYAAFISLLINSGTFIVFSLLTSPTRGEQRAADDCLVYSLNRAVADELQASSVAEIQTALARVFGATFSSREVDQALRELQLPQTEKRPYALNQIRTRMESNLASTLGQTIAHRVVERLVPYKATPRVTGLNPAYGIENRLEESRSQLTGLAAELDNLRRYHRQILQDLPTAVCSIGVDHSVLLWNGAMERLSGIDAAQVIGAPLQSLPLVWFELLDSFAEDAAVHRSKTTLVNGEQRLQLNLHKALIDTVPQAQGDMVIVIEDTTEAQRLEAQLLHTERLALIGQLAAGVAHEIGNPVTGIACLGQNLLLDGAESELKETANQILEQTGRISSILQSLVNFAHGGRYDQRTKVPVNLHQCVDEAIKLLSLTRSEHGVRFINNLNNDARVFGDPQRLAQVFVNLLTNARDASTDGDQVQVDGTHQADQVVINITDQGQGINATQLDQVFDPFFTTKDPGQGTGLGLTIVATIIEEHRGTIHAASAGNGQGTCFRIALPCDQSTQSATAGG